MTRKYCFMDAKRPCDLTCKAAFEVDDPIDNVDCYFVWLAYHLGEGLYEIRRSMEGGAEPGGGPFGASGFGPAGPGHAGPGPGGPGHGGPGHGGPGHGGPGHGGPKGPKGGISNN